MWYPYGNGQLCHGISSMTNQAKIAIDSSHYPDNAISFAEWERHDFVEVANGVLIQMSPPSLQRHL